MEMLRQLKESIGAEKAAEREERVKRAYFERYPLELEQMRQEERSR